MSAAPRQPVEVHPCLSPGGRRRKRPDEPVHGVGSPPSRTRCSCTRPTAPSWRPAADEDRGRIRPPKATEPAATRPPRGSRWSVRPVRRPRAAIRPAPFAGPVRELGEVPGQSDELLGGRLDQALQRALAPWGEAQAYDAAILAVAHAPDQSRLLRPVHQSDNAVVAEQQVVGDLADGWSSGVGVTPDGQEKLMLRWGQPGAGALFLAPPEEPTQIGPQLQQELVLLRSGPFRDARSFPVSLGVPMVQAAYM